MIGPVQLAYSSEALLVEITDLVLALPNAC